MHPLNRITSRTEQSHPWHHHRQQHRHIVYMVHDASLTTYVYLFENWEGKGQFDGAADRNRLRCRRNRIRAVQRIHIHHTWSLLVLSPMNGETRNPPADTHDNDSSANASSTYDRPPSDRLSPRRSPRLHVRLLTFHG
jgi:hypothetical protein